MPLPFFLFALSSPFFVELTNPEKQTDYTQLLFLVADAEQTDRQAYRQEASAT